MSHRTPSRLPKWLRHRGLIAAEAVLLVGVLKDMLGVQLKASALPGWAKVLLVMGLTLGLLGGLFLAVQKLTTRGVAKTHEVMQALPLPVPLLAIHIAVLAGLFVLYARLLEIPLVIWGWQVL